MSSFPSITKTRPIGESVYNNLKFLKTIVKTKSEKKRRRLLRLATTTELLTIVEIAINIIKARFLLTTRQRTRLVPYVEYIRRLARARSESGARKIVQKGGSLGLVALLTPIIIEAIKHFTKNGS
jgi:hypothetical protein